MTEIKMSADELAALKQQIFDLTAKYAREVHLPKPFVPGVSPVPVSGKVQDETDVVSLVDSALDFWLTAGRFNHAFEAKLGKFLNKKFVLTTNSGSSANLIAFTGLTSHLLGDRRVQAGDEFITCATGFPTTINPAITHGLVPVFLDVDIPTYNVDVSKLEEAITPKTKAIMIAHTLGNPFDLDAIMAVAKKHNLWVIEDCCDALGAEYNGQLVGTFGDVGTLSFYPAHHITMGEGGAVFLHNPILKRAIESFRDWGRDCWCEAGMDNTCKRRFDWQLGDLPYGYDHKYIYSHLGFNLKITDMQAAVGLAQMGHLEGFIAARRANFNYLKAGLKQFEEHLILPEATPKSNPSWFGFPITIREGSKISRDDLVKFLNSEKIATRLMFGSNLIRQPYMKDRNYRVVGDLTNSNIVVDKSFWVGVFPGLTTLHLDYMIEKFGKFIKSKA